MRSRPRFDLRKVGKIPNEARAAQASSAGRSRLADQALGCASMARLAIAV